MLIWGVLAILWPLTYFGIEPIYMVYLSYYWIGGINIGAIIFGFISLMFLISAITATEANWISFIAHLVLSPIAIYVSHMFYPTAHAYYVPQVKPVENNEKIDTSPEETETDPETDPKPEPEKPKDDIPEEVPDNNSPFVDFLMVTI